MERSREIKGAAGASRRLRISCTKDPTDAEAQMDDTPLIEKVKKGNLQALTASYPASATKRKRHGLQEAHNLSEGISFGKDFPESTPSDVYDNDAPQGTVNRKQRAKKDELVMNICNIPRRARSCATRVPFASSRQLVPTSQQRSPSPGICDDKLRQVGVKSRLLKDLEAMDSEQISNQEVEIAGLLYDLSRSMPTFVESTSGKCEEKSRRDLEEEELISSSSSIAGLEKLSKACGPLSYDQKRKRQRVFENQEERPCMPPAERVNASTDCCLNELPVLVKEDNQVNESEGKRGVVSKLFCQQLEPKSRDIAKDPCHEDVNTTEERGQEEKASKDNQTHFAEQAYKKDSLELSSLSINKSELSSQVFCKGGNRSKVSSRIQKAPEPEESGMSIRKDMWTLLESCTGKVFCTDSKKVIQGKVGEAPVKDERRLGTTDVPRWNQGLSKAALSQGKGEQQDLRSLDVKNENTVIPDVCKGQETFSGVSLVSPAQSSPSSATTSSGWMGTFPQLGLTKKAGHSWLTNCLHSGSSPHQPVQLPHAAGAQHFVRRMRRCATHVHIAHFIQQQQQFRHRPFWPPSCDPHNLSNANLQGKEYWSNKVPSLQAEHRHTWAENTGSRMSYSRGTVSSPKNENCLAGYNSSAQVLSVGAGIKKGCGNSKIMMTSAQLKQSTLNSTGPNTIRLSLNRSPAQSASVFNKGLYSAHLSSQNNLAQQGSALPKCQQGTHASLHVSLSHSHSAQPQAQYEQLKQQHSLATPLPQLCGAGSGALLEGNRLGFR